MRVTNNLIYGQSSRAIGQANEKILNAQEKISAQTDIVRPSDNPVGASQILMYEGSNNRLKLFDESMKMATSHLEYQEVALESLNDSMDDIRTLFIQAQNDINTQEDIDAIVQEVALITESMAELMNSKSADGNYIFAGTDTQGPPFILDSQGRYQWAGNEGQKYAQISEDMKIPVSDSGKKLFQDIWTNRTFSAQALTGDVMLSAKVGNQGDFNQFMANNYDPENPSSNIFRLTTTPIIAAGATPPPVDSTNLGSDTKADQDRRRAFDGTPGSYSITNNLGEVVSSGLYTAGKPINFGGMSFLMKGEPGATADVTLEKPRRDNVLNEINDTLAVLSDRNSSSEDRERAFSDANASINNAQRKVSEGRSSVGARLNILRDRESFSSANQLSNAVSQDRIAGLDIAAAATELSMKESALSASQKVFTRMSNLSLFNKM
ncbi:MAG: flagellar hook-associated protein FlgL [Gammaproteobacteria bacterium]|jgi:flagellar hook-associated protein 3 FlgL|uniref:flagellar hook-associated protein FlgL n=1 Tax=Marinomonas sp. ef1 TaxID=2005043 RepID=UPI000C2906DD|nr:flagellar hook-associated protein FlgL [Marinomonas sp. ef1]MBU1293711.1 flagellar hook-associated protein FlgL [Gammaproteobacteria bacterium]MBU1466741.1 flagellar hook-associated protein FlgL [Gammaproteobacteria bacterium]MBU2021041.1 flagellar hook-associated protein FlgL [Gammaproteobacteria bacterium]MBU2240594.1 flagellar hook-associated protein FlgL [Gammaproteobacteria bacterium]MBU2319996.1 flagellar hook-associated protein FlgL [Gammaproteobacteria bacterium]